MSKKWENRPRPTQKDFDAWVELLIEGMEPSTAAKQVGWTCTAFKRADAGAHAEALTISRDARGHYADEKAEKWAHEPEADFRMRELWLTRWNAAYKRSAAIELTGGVDVNNGVAEAIDRFTDAVAVAAVRGSAGGREALPAGAADPGSDRQVGVPVGGLAGTT